MNTALDRKIKALENTNKNMRGRLMESQIAIERKESV